MAKYNVKIVVEAETEEAVEKLLDAANWIDSYDSIDEQIEEIPDDGDDED